MNKGDIPMRTLFLDKQLFYPYTRWENGKFPWEDISFVSGKIQQLLSSNGVIYYRNELMRVRFSREVADLIGWKKVAKTFFAQVFQDFREQSVAIPDFVDIEMSAPQR